MFLTFIFTASNLIAKIIFSKVSEVDCVVFGFMVIAKYAPVTKVSLLDNYANVSNYIERMKNEFYPNWNDLLTNKN